jgi:voltage-gated sodium channel
MRDNIASIMQKITTSKLFESSIMVVIFINCIVIGLETYDKNYIYDLVNTICLVIYTIEILMRFVARSSLKQFFSSGWNLFDLFVVVVSYIPDDISTNSGVIAAIRVLRVFRILRLFKSSMELRLIISVMIRSMKSLTYNALVMLIFMYVFAVAGVMFFRLPDASTATHEQVIALEQLKEAAPNAPSNSDDPYGTLSESLFTLLRCMTGEDWTDLRYNLVTASRMDLIPVAPWVVTFYHIIWFVFAAFLLINLVVGAVINNYQIIMDEEKKNVSEQRAKELE